MTIASVVVLSLLGAAASCDLLPAAGERAARPETPLRLAEPEIRVRVVESADQIEIRPAEGGTTVTIGSGATRELAGAATASAGVGGARFVGPAADLIGSGASVAIDPPPGGSVLVDGRPMPGRVTLVPSGGGLDAVVELPMELYVEGVIAAELVADWPREAFAAQAVSARSYALHERDRARRADRGFDVESTTLDQVYRGATDNERAKAGAAMTRGVVLVDGSKVLRAYYSSTCGDRAASAAGVWPSGPPLTFNRSPAIQAQPRWCPCDASPLHRWQRARGAGELRDRLRAWGERRELGIRSIGTVRRIEIVDRNAAGRPERYSIADERGRRFELTAEDLRVALNTPAPGHPDVDRQTRVPSGDFSARVEADGAARFTGQGFGHGVGLCQWGARGLAVEGWAWEAIVRHYYPGAELREIW